MKIKLLRPVHTYWNIYHKKEYFAELWVVVNLRKSLEAYYNETPMATQVKNLSTLQLKLIYLFGEANEN